MMARLNVNTLDQQSDISLRANVAAGGLSWLGFFYFAYRSDA